jgi:hypothetical protein
LSLRCCTLSVERFLPISYSNVLQFVVFNHWIRKQIATEIAQSLFEITVLPVDVDLHVFPDSNTADFRHAQMLHGVTNCSTLGIQHRSFRHDDDLCFHLHIYPPKDGFVQWRICARPANKRNLKRDYLLQDNDVQHSVAAQDIDPHISFVVPGQQKVHTRGSYLQSADRHLLEETR